MAINTVARLLPLFCLSCYLYSSAAAADIAIIAHPEFAADSTTAEDVRRLFLGKTNNISGEHATPIDQKNDDAERAQFYDAIVKKTASQLRAYWSRLVFTGKGKPPKALDDDAAVLSAVAADSSLIGYVDVNAVTSDVKILLTVP